MSYQDGWSPAFTMGPGAYGEVAGMGRNGRRFAVMVVASIVGWAALPGAEASAYRATFEVSVGVPVTVIADGAAARVSADVTCAAPQTMLNLNLVERTGLRIAHGTFYDVADCTGAPHRMVVSLPALDAPFHAGVAFLQATLSSCAQIPCTTTSRESEVPVRTGNGGSGLPGGGGPVPPVGPPRPTVPPRPTTPPWSARVTRAARLESIVDARIATPVPVFAGGAAARLAVDYLCESPRTAFVALSAYQRTGSTMAYGAVQGSALCTDRRSRMVLSAQVQGSGFHSGLAFVQARLSSCILNPEVPCFRAYDEAVVGLGDPIR